MKKILLILAVPALIAGTLFSLESCNKNRTEPVKITLGVYTAGNEYDASTGKTVPVVYYNDGELYRLDEGCSIMGVAWVNDGIYACGYRIIDNKPVFWRNGAISNTLFEDEGRMLDMVSDGTDWISCGFVETGGKRYGVIYKNGTEFYRHKDPSVFGDIDTGASGDYYVTSISDENLALLRISVSNKSVSQTTIITGDTQYEPTDLYVGLNDICVSLMKSGNGSEKQAYCWLSRYNGPIALSDKVSRAYSVTLYNGAVFVGGSILADGNTHCAVQWINGNAEDYSYECNPGNSYVKLLLSNAYGLFEAVQSPGQVQICNAGALMFNINCAPQFEAKAWDIIREK